MFSQDYLQKTFFDIRRHAMSGVTPTSALKINKMPPSAYSSLEETLSSATEAIPNAEAQILEPIDYALIDKQVPGSLFKNPSLNQITSKTDGFVDSPSRKWNKYQIAAQLWKNPDTLISEETVLKVNTVQAYLEKEGFELRGAPADGDCFCHAFFGSHEVLPSDNKIPLLEAADDKIAFLREHISAQFRSSPQGSKNGRRVDELQKKGNWITGDEGDLLAIALRIPIRLITLNYYPKEKRCGLRDMLTFANANIERQDWDSIQPNDKPQVYIFIIDLERHFVFASKISTAKASATLPKKNIKETDLIETALNVSTESTSTQEKIARTRKKVLSQSSESYPSTASLAIDFVRGTFSYMQYPFFMEDRETRSTLFSLGEMICHGIDPKTGEMIAEFKSEEQFRKYCLALAKMAAEHQNYAMAKYYTQKLGDPGKLQSPEANIHLLTWFEKASRATSSQIKKDGDEEGKSHEYSYRAKAVDAERENKEIRYKEALNAMKKALLSLKNQAPEQDSISIFLENFSLATTLDPYTFGPYHLGLFFGSIFYTHFPQATEVILSRAYDLSSIRTFNILVAILLVHLSDLSQEGSRQRFHQILTLFIKRFPNDIAGYNIANYAALNGVDVLPNPKIQETTQRKTFSECLANGLMALRRKDFAEAREHFSRAEYHHISDKRPYLYKFLIDLKEGDIQSAYKLQIKLSYLLNWSSPDDVKKFKNQYFEYIFENGTLSHRSSSCLETPVLNALFELFRSERVDENNLAKFSETFQSYLTSAEADLIWADLTLTLLHERFEVLKPESNDHEIKYFLNLNLILMSSIFSKLKYFGDELSDYEEDLFVTEEGNLALRPRFLMAWPEIQDASISIDPNSFQIPHENESEILREILWDRYYFFSLSLLNINHLDDLLSHLDQLNLRKESYLYEPFVSILLKLMDSGSSDQQSWLVAWASENLDIWPASQIQALHCAILRWQLKQPIPCQGVPRLIQTSNRWLESNQYNPSNGALEIAYNAWNLLKNQKMKEANAEIATFFEHWESRLESGVDPVALNVICLVRALINVPRIVQTIPEKATSALHAELIGLALTMISREGVGRPYVIPSFPMPRQERLKLCRLYLGQRKNETDQEYSQRLQEFRLPNFSDLREAKRINEDLIPDPSEMKWSIPSTHLTSMKEMEAILEEIINQQRIRCQNNERVSQMSPDYTQDPNFIRWVTYYPKLILRYVEDPKKVLDDFNRAFPRFPAREKFIEELEEKAKDLIRFQEIKENMPKAEKNSDKRFWQLIKISSELIDTVLTSKRNEDTFDLVLLNEQEAYFVMKLIYEWSLQHGNGYSQALADAFHGPEIHIWGKGPRIPHFNAGVYKYPKYINIHLFFEN